jgi:lysozyme
MITGEAGRALIRASEGLRLTAYKCPAGVPTIGYGWTGLVNGKPIVVGVTKITQDEAETLLTQGLKIYETYVNSNVKVKLTQNQFDALISFTYNNGIGGLLQLIKCSGLNNGNYAEVPAHLIQYDKATINGKLQELQGLKNRRLREIVLWNKK